MIILKFGEGVAEAKTISKPSLQAGIQKILMEMYTGEIAERNAEEIAEYIYDNMRFPEDGIYCIEEGLLKRFDVEKTQWENTLNSTIDYIVQLDSALWNCFNNEFLHLKDMSSEIMQYVKCETEAMFEHDEWHPVSSINIRDWKIYHNKDGITNILESFFTSEKAIAIAGDVRKQMFGVQDTNVVIIQDGLRIKSAITNQEVKQFNDGNFQKIEKLFKGKLKASEIKEVLIRLRNMICFGMDTTLGELISINDDGYCIIMHKGHECCIVEEQLFLKVDEDVFQFIKHAIECMELKHGEDDTDIPKTALSIPELNGIELYVEEYFGEYSIYINDHLPSLFAEVQIKNGKKELTFLKEDFIGRYVYVKL